MRQFVRVQTFSLGRAHGGLMTARRRRARSLIQVKRARSRGDGKLRGAHGLLQDRTGDDLVTGGHDPSAWPLCRIRVSLERTRQLVDLSKHLLFD
ncbi:MAG: hypothetical protein Q8M64_14760 [Methyloversatilis sp.]|nr:hypothetical protein [Methyloversatilis sp.]